MGGAVHQANFLAYLQQNCSQLDLICLDPFHENPGHIFADRSIYSSYTNLGSYVFSHSNTLISTFGSDNAEYIYLTSSFGEHIIDRDIRLQLLTKSSSRALFSQIIPQNSVSWHEKIESTDHFFESFSNHRSQKIVVKPNISSGSKGVFIVDSDDDFNLYRKKLNDSFGISMDNSIHVEPYVPNSGIKYYCEGIYSKGKLYIILGQSIMGGAEGLTPIGSVYLAQLSPEMITSDTPPLYANLLKCLKEFFSKSLISDTFFNCDFFETFDNNVHLIELSPRPGGNFLPVVFGYIWDINFFDYYYQYLITRSIRNIPSTSFSQNPISILVSMNCSELPSQYFLNYNKLDSLLPPSYISMYPNIGIFGRK